MRLQRLLLATLALAVAAPLSAFEEGELLIWINGDKGYRGLQEVGDRFAEELGIPVRVEAPEGATDKFQQAAQSGQGPDIFFWPHDRLGEWADAGLLRPIDVDPAFRAQYYDMAWEAFTHDGRLWAYPISLEAVALIYNKELIETPPTQLSEIPAIHEELTAEDPELASILWDYNNTYFTWGLLASDGGYVFGRDDAGAYDVRDVGVNAPGAIQALEELVGLVDNGTMPRGVSYSVMTAKMNAGDLGMMISGPWEWSNLRTNDIEFGVAPIPGINGQPGRPFVGVLGGMINRASPNADLAELFMQEYLMQPEGLEVMDADVPLGVPAHIGFAEQLAAESDLIAGSLQSVESGVLMPNVPRMGRFWAAMGSALSNATNGQLGSQEALDLAATRIRPRN